MSRVVTKLTLAFAGLLVGGPLHAQVSTLLPEHVRDSTVAAEARTPAVLRVRQRYLDSLAAGRRRWAAAGVIEYQIQAHQECFCFEEPDSTTPLLLVVVRNGKIVGRATGRPADGIPQLTTIDSLFAFVERDLVDPGRIVDRLQLDPQFGFPRDYLALTANIADLSLRIRVDSFAVVQAKAGVKRARAYQP
ncbi:MAG: DUF6174 domain-containing protein [Gemmatimonadota bacterium]